MVQKAVTPEKSAEETPSLTVTNTRTRRGTEVVQLYAADTATGVTPRTAARRVRPARPRARSGGGERGQQFERYPVQRRVHHHRRNSLHPRGGPRAPLRRDGQPAGVTGSRAHGWEGGSRTPYRPTSTSAVSPGARRAARKSPSNPPPCRTAPSHRDPPPRGRPTCR